MRFKLKVRRGARALVMLIGRPEIDFEQFAVCRCDERNFREALRYAQSRVALPTFIIGGDFAIRAAEHVLDLRGVVAWNPSEAASEAASRLTVPLLVIGGAPQVAGALADASRLTIGGDDPELVAHVAARFVGAYS
ncbi:MAG TPA: hypothetical protein VL284_15940 [Thermoanaerobaculia bacterium]|nr:hypothetical protein [Thermoanaerobaculia bacterium]